MQIPPPTFASSVRSPIPTVAPVPTTMQIPPPTFSSSVRSPNPTPAPVPKLAPMPTPTIPTLTSSVRSPNPTPMPPPTISVPTLTSSVRSPISTLTSSVRTLIPTLTPSVRSPIPTLTPTTTMQMSTPTTPVSTLTSSVRLPITPTLPSSTLPSSTLSSNIRMPMIAPTLSTTLKNNQDFNVMAATVPVPVRATPVNVDVRMANVADLTPLNIDRDIEKDFMSTPAYEFDDNDVAMQEAIEASFRASESAKLASITANNSISSRYIPFQTVIQDQDDEYERAMREDMERERRERIREEEARILAEENRLAEERELAAAEEARLALEKLKQVEAERIAALTPPTLLYPITDLQDPNLLTLRFRLPNGRFITHVFNRNEPLLSVTQQIRYDTQTLQDLIFTRYPNRQILCDSKDTIASCGFQNRETINVDIAN